MIRAVLRTAQEAAKVACLAAVAVKMTEGVQKAAPVVASKARAAIEGVKRRAGRLRRAR